MDKFDIQVDRNLKGIEYEKCGEISKAIDLYEKNIAENFEGNHPYDRLAVIYRKQKRLDDEIRVLEKAIYVFENIVYKNRGDRTPKLEKFIKRLIKVKKLKMKKFKQSLKEMSENFIKITGAVK
ncbi:tetratricopeptide repeat protein [Haloimpatiens sp. FM7330]|uniref:tetratricopeptide repeat protein n=1 Tax=Haloimpatiens sp. FM7330 TaxID=3298610 RepID=UPI003635C461